MKTKVCSEETNMRLLPCFVLVVAVGVSPVHAQAPKVDPNTTVMPVAKMGKIKTYTYNGPKQIPGTDLPDNHKIAIGPSDTLIIKSGLKPEELESVWFGMIPKPTNTNIKLQAVIMDGLVTYVVTATGPGYGTVVFRPVHKDNPALESPHSLMFELAVAGQP